MDAVIIDAEAEAQRTVLAMERAVSGREAAIARADELEHALEAMAAQSAARGREVEQLRQRLENRGIAEQQTRDAAEAAVQTLGSKVERLESEADGSHQREVEQLRQQLANRGLAEQQTRDAAEAAVQSLESKVRGLVRQLRAVQAERDQLRRCVQGLFEVGGRAAAASERHFSAIALKMRAADATARIESAMAAEGEAP